MDDGCIRIRSHTLVRKSVFTWSRFWSVNVSPLHYRNKFVELRSSAVNLQNFNFLPVTFAIKLSNSKSLASHRQYCTASGKESCTEKSFVDLESSEDKSLSKMTKHEFEKLPKTVVPTNYVLTLKPDLKKLVFEGSTKTTIKVSKF